MSDGFIIEKLLQEKQRREKPINLLEGSFSAQEQFVKDPSRRKVALCNRRAAKSYSIGIDLCTTGLLYPGSTMTFLSMTLGTCQRILIKDIIHPLNDLFKLNLQIMSKEVRFPNGSVIYMVGIDQSEKQKNKLLGQKQRLLCIDEAQDLTVDLEDLIERVIEPALIDLNGRIIMAGTPSDNTSTYFYQITQGYKSTAGWSYHSWLSSQNPYMADKVQKLIEDKEKENPFFKSTDYYQQMYLGKWVINKDALIYKPTPQNFDVDELPKLPQGEEYIYILGIDLGYKDADAFIVMAYSFHDKHLYIIEAHRQTGNDDVATALMIKKLAMRYNFATMVIDGAALKSVETMRQRFGLPLKAANKLGKKDHITLMNMDLQAGIIKIFPQPAILLQEEWKKLIWDPKRPGKEKEGLDNHCCFVAGTKITTNQGLVNIEDLNSSHLILTRKGFKSFTYKIISNNQLTYQLTTINGKQIIATADHPFFVDNKFVHLKDLHPGDNLTCIEDNQEHKCQINMENQKKSYLMELPIDDIHNRKIEHSESIIVPVMDMPADYIEKFGNITMEKFQKDIIFIIKMIIHSIMTLVIYNLLKAKNILKIIWLKDYQILLNIRNVLLVYLKLLKKHLNGTNLKKVESGTFNMELMSGIIDNHLFYNVKFANNNLIPKLAQHKFVETNVMQNKDEIQELMTLPKLVIVENNLLPINIVKSDSVLEVVATGKKEKVYNITVLDEHEYFANNILVSNCDAALYGFMEAHNWASIIPITTMPTEQELFDRECDEAAMNQGGLIGQLQYGFDRSYKNGF